METLAPCRVCGSLPVFIRTGFMADNPEWGTYQCPKCRFANPHTKKEASQLWNKQHGT